MNTVFVGTDLDEEVGTRNLTTGITQFCTIIIALLTLLMSTGSRTRHLDGDRIRGDGLATRHDMGRRNGEGTILRSTDNIGIGDRRSGASMSVNHLITRLHGTIRTYEYLEFIRDIACTEIAHILRVHRICKTELLTHCHMGRGRTR